ncbi:hypothetical protein Q3G72_017782 [Acer saccharum]|nr:hypothetical protein Q3G72_017782 [Acer saccharum]
MKTLGSNFERQPHVASQVCDQEGTYLNARPTSYANNNNNQGYQQWPPQSTQPWQVPRNRDNNQPSGGQSHDNRLATDRERLTSMEGIARTMELQVERLATDRERLTSMEGIVRTMELQVEQIVGSQQQMELRRLPSQTEQANALTTLRSGKVISEPSPPEIFNVPIYVSGDSSNRYNVEELANEEAGTRKEPEETYEVLSEIDISLPIFETMTSLGETEEFDVLESTKHLIEILECFGIQDEKLEDEPHLASGYFRESTHMELDDFPTPLVEHDSPRMEDMVTKLREDHQVMLEMNLELTTKLDEVFRYATCYMKFGKVLDPF